MTPLGLTRPNQPRTVRRPHLPPSRHVGMLVLTVILVSGMLLQNGISGGQPIAEARTISLSSAQIEMITSRILPMLDRADQRSLRVRIAAIQNSASNTSMSYLDPAYQDNPVYAM
jgi:hypothetical protein